MNKKGMKYGGVVVSVVMIMLFLALIFVGYQQGWFEKQDATQGTGSGGIVDCGDNEPYIMNDTVNAESKGSKVAVTYEYFVDKNGNGAVDSGEVISTLTPGSTGSKFAVGDNLVIISSATNYLDRIDTFKITKCGQNSFHNEIYATDAVLLDILEGATEVSDVSTAVGTLNISKAVVAGGSVDFTVKLSGRDDQSTGQILLTVEVNDTEVDEITISEESASARVIDDDYSTELDLFATEGTLTTKGAFVVDEIVGAKTALYLITLTSESGETIGTSGTPVFVNAYSGEWFTDVDGTLQFGFEDADGGVEYEDKATDHDAWIA